MSKRILSIVLTICLIAATLSIGGAPVSAAPIYGTELNLSEGSIVINDTGPYTITQPEGGTTSNTITINSDATVYLDGVNILVPAPDTYSDVLTPNPINISGDCVVNLYLVDGSENTLASAEGNIDGMTITRSSGKAALRVPSGATLNIYGDTGILNAYGAKAYKLTSVESDYSYGSGGAGIGGDGGDGNTAENSGVVNIFGGIVNATGGDSNYRQSGYAIGGVLTIAGGHLIARSGSLGATIRSPLSEQPVIQYDYQWRADEESLFVDSDYTYSDMQRYVELITLSTYKVEHYQENLNGSYSLANTDNLTGTTAALVTAAAKTYAGFSENTSHLSRISSGTINADGSTVLKLYYDRDVYTVTFQDHDGATLKTQSVAYEGSATAPTSPTRTGYTFSGWSSTFNNVTSNITVTANYTANTGTAYEVEHYKETLAGGYELANTDSLTGTTATTATAAAKIYTGFNENTSHTSRIISGTINADGSTVLKLYYDRNEYSVRYVNHDGSVLASDEVAYGDFTEAPATPVRAYHSFAGWFTDNDTFMNEWIFAEKQVTAATNLYAKWTKIPQSITHVSIDDQTKVAVEGLSNKINLTETEIENAADIFVFVKADPIQISESIQEKVESEIDRKGLKLLNVFDIGLYKRVTTYEGVSTETSISNEDILGKIIVRIPLTEEQAKKDNLAIAYIDDEGNITIIAGKIISEGEAKYFEFETDHFSTYSLVETSIVNIPVTGEKTDSRMPLGLLALLFAMGVLIVTKRKLTKEEIE